MPLSAGDKLGPYEILAPIGAGGMGEVYRARDPRLNRDVAVKISQEHFSDRFEREARAVAALNHPNICTLFDVGPDFLVMELIEGEAPKGPLPLDEALAIARQIADALDAAHEKGIVHRDLKPANIKIKPDGAVKVLDFGLARTMEAASGDPRNSPTNSPTMTISPTRAGMLMGTAAYMSPEQARGKAVDKRADIWAFGVVLYELLTGRRPFHGEDLTEILASVLRDKPDRSAVPVQVRRLIESCLEKDPKKRLRDIGDVWGRLDQPVLQPADAAPDRSKLYWLPWAIAVLTLVAAGVATWEWWHVPAPSPRTVTRSVMSLPSFALYPALSRDGTRLVYSQSDAGLPRLTLRMMDQLEGKPIPGAEYGLYAEFSPDGQWIVYLSFPPPFKLKKIPVTGGASITLCDVPHRPTESGGESWGPDDSIVFSSAAGLMRVPAAGGTPQSLTTVNTKNGESSHSRPQFLPGGYAILFTIGGDSADSSRIAMLDLKTGAYRVLVNGGFAGRYVPSGHLVYARGGILFAIPFDVKRLTVTGSETPVVESVYSEHYAFSDSSLLVFNSSGFASKPSSKLEWTDRQGVAQVLPEPPHAWAEIAVSPHGNLVAGSIIDSTGGIWIYDLERRRMSRMTFEGWSYNPVWSPDGRWVTYQLVHRGKSGMYRVAADKSGPPELLVADEIGVIPQSWTPDGKTLFFNQMKDGKIQIWMLPAPGSSGESQPRRFSGSSFNQEGGQISPDGKWLAYSSDESGRYEVYVVPFPGPGGKSQISVQGGRVPVWSRKGRELYFVDANTNQLMAVDVPAGPVFRAGRPQALFKLPGSNPTDAVWAVTPDPKRFLVAHLPETAAGTTFTVITNWFDDLLRRAPLKH